jgi:hypothetical protein
MIVKIKRQELPTKTCGEMFVDDNHFGWVLEDHCRDKNKDGVLEEKIYGETALPYGRYRLIITYSGTFKKRMIQIVNVKGGNIKFGDYSVDAAGCRIHGGNTIKDTFGCPLLGENKKDDGDVYNCKAINEKLFLLVEKADTTGIVYLDIV